MKLIDVDSKATLEDFLTLKKNELVQFLRNVMKKSVVTRMSLRLDKDVETYLLKSRSGDNERMSCNRQTLTFKKKIIYTTFPFFNFYTNSYLLI